MPADLTWRKAIDKVLGESTRPLHYNEITERIIADGLRSKLGAHTCGDCQCATLVVDQTRLGQPHHTFGSLILLRKIDIA